ncbi:MAG: 4-alpha-glucanotransferase [Bacteroidetes bacterium]|nr:MAG: 4-alpha-glucanotransferase [Bacteroidota bacterium]
MTIHFYLRYKSTLGQQFFICGNTPALGNNQLANAVALHYLNDEFWMATVDVPVDTPAFAYYYVLRNKDGVDNMELCADRTIDPAAVKQQELQVVDAWNYAGQLENAFYTQPFTNTLLKPPMAKAKPKLPKNITHVFKVKAPLLQPHQTLCLLGSNAELGAWQTETAVLMQRQGNWHTVALDLSQASFPVWYKYGVWNTQTNGFERYEDGANRKLHGIGKRQLTILHDGFAGLPNTGFKGAGVAIPVFSLRTARSFGVGEFTDLKLLVDWSKHIGLKLIQLLPVNDTTSTNTWLDSYPYAPISVFALHPLYLNVYHMAGKKHGKLLVDLDLQKEDLNALPEIDYELVMKTKWRAIADLYEAMKVDWLADPQYQLFFEANKHWLQPYAAFCYLRQKNKTADFKAWSSHSTYQAKLIEKLFAPTAKTFDLVNIHLFVQYHLHLQLKDAVDYAHQNGLIMKGDLPIGIYRYSCDAWVQPDLYNLNAQAGAPPDNFAVKGQNWGFPTYNWKQMQADGFAWWKQRFEQMSLYFDAFRIDHILGFFRIWSIPLHAVEGLLGHFEPAIPVYSSEFNERGIWFDKNRYCLPYITNGLVGELFGTQANHVKDFFLVPNAWGNYDLKPEFDTQRKVEAWFAAHPEAESWMPARLFELITNVILIEDEDRPNAFHFRIGMDGTSSFAALDAHVQQQLKTLYVDYYFKRQDGFWRKQALQKLPALKAATNMLVCGEDLGMVPDCVPGVMKDLGLLTLEIQRMPKDPKSPFFHPADAPYLSVVTPSTHDMSTIRGWWEEDQTVTQKFYNQQLGQHGGAPFYCEDWINKAIITQHVYSPAMWSIFQLQDLMGIDAKLRRSDPNDERINVPANPKHFWRYRMHISLEDLLQTEGFNGTLRGLLEASGRA